MKQIILIFGPGRSGTSLVARLISKLGADLGENLIGGNKSNPDGYFEDREIIALHKELLTLFAPPDSYGATLPLPVNWLDHEAVAGIEARIRSCAEKKLIDNNQIAIKDPRVCMLVPLWQRIANNIGAELKCVVCIRHPAAMASSQEKATTIPIAVGEAMWLSRTAYAFDYLQNDGVIVDFDTMISDPATSVKRICDYIAGQNHYDNQAIDQLMLDSLVKPDYRHAPATLQVLHAESNALYEALLAIQEPGSDRRVMLSLCANTIASLRTTPGKNEAIKVSRVRVRSLEKRLRKDDNDIRVLQAKVAELELDKASLARAKERLERIEDSSWMRLGNRLKQSRNEPVSAIFAVLDFLGGWIAKLWRVDKGISDASAVSPPLDRANASVPKPDLPGSTEIKNVGSKCD